MTITSFLLSLSLGIAFGWLLRYVSIRDRLARQALDLEEELPKFEKCAAESRERDAFSQAADADIDLTLLTCLELGEVANAKKILMHKLGQFYHQWNSKPEGETVSTHIQKQLSVIRETAKDFESVRVVLTYKPGDEYNF